MFTCPRKFGGWLQEEWRFFPVMGAQLVLRSCLRRLLLQTALPRISPRSLQLKIWQFLFSKLRSSFFQEHLLPLHTNSHLGTRPMHQSAAQGLTEGGLTSHYSVMTRSPWEFLITAWRASLIETAKTLKGSTRKDMQNDQNEAASNQPIFLE